MCWKEVLPSIRKGVKSVVWLTLKNALLEYLIKHPASIALPNVLGRQLAKVVLRIDKHSAQTLWLMFRLHCAIAQTVSLLPFSRLVEAAQKSGVLGVATRRSDTNSFTVSLNASCDDVLLPHTPTLPRTLASVQKLLFSYLQQNKPMT